MSLVLVAHIPAWDLLGQPRLASRNLAAGPNWVGY